MFDVVSLGAATLDVFLRSSEFAVQKENGKKELCVIYGAKIEIDEVHFDLGGGGTNSAVTFARQGLKVASIVKIGEDFAGRKVREDLEGAGVDTSLTAEEKDEHTDYSTILWAPDGGRTILVYRGKTKLEVEDINWEGLKTKWFYISSIEGNLEIPEEIQRSKDPKRRRPNMPHTRVAWNPGRKELEQRERVLAILPQIELLNLNKEEMIELLAMKQCSNVAIREILRSAQGLPCRYIIITDDRNGSYIWQKDTKKWLWSGIYNTPKVEATGAGDAYGSGFVTGLVKGWEIRDCLQLAAANASSVVLRPGAKKGILKPEEMSKWLKMDLEIKEMRIE